MPAERTTMRQVREVLRLKFVGGVPIHRTEGGLFANSGNDPAWLHSLPERMARPRPTPRKSRQKTPTENADRLDATAIAAR
jgi:hypothetical protein